MSLGAASSACALVAAAAASGALAGSTPARAVPLFRLSPIAAVTVRGESATRFTVRVTGAPVDNRPALRWTLKLRQSGSAASSCDDGPLFGGRPAGAGVTEWTNQGSTFVWFHGAKGSYPADPGYGCDRAAGLAGSVSVVAENELSHCTATIPIALGSAQPRHGPAPSCAIGGFAVSASALPVPHELLALYAKERSELAALIAQARKGHIPASSRIGLVTRKQAGVLARDLPPVWSCPGPGVLDPIVRSETALSGAPQLARQAAELSLRTVAGALEAETAALRRCEASRASPGGVPGSVVASLAALSRSATGQATDARRTSPRLLRVELVALQARLGQITNGFPRVFGIPYSELVRRLVAQAAATGAAEHAAASGATAGVLSELAAIAGPVAATDRDLEREARRVTAIENANS